MSYLEVNKSGTRDKLQVWNSRALCRQEEEQKEGRCIIYLKLKNLIIKKTLKNVLPGFFAFSFSIGPPPGADLLPPHTHHAAKIDR